MFTKSCTRSLQERTAPGLTGSRVDRGQTKPNVSLSICQAVSRLRLCAPDLFARQLPHVTSVPLRHVTRRNQRIPASVRSGCAPEAL